MMALLYSSLVTLVLGLAFAQEDCPASTTTCPYTNVGFHSSGNNQANQHYYIGGLFGVHEEPQDAYSCSRAPIRDRGIINLEAFLWAIRTFSSSISAVGGVALDSCSSSDQNIENILSFETCKVTLGETSPVSPRNLLAYVGPDRSSQVNAVSSLLYEMNKTHVSHAATSPNLRNSGRDSFFLRTVPTDSKDIEVIHQLMSKLSVKYVMAIYQDDEYGKGLWQKFEPAVNSSGICVVYKEKMTSANMAQIAANLQSRLQVRYIALLMTSAKVQELMTYLRSAPTFQIGQFYFIGTSSWGTTPGITEGGGISGYTVLVSAPQPIQAQLSQFYSYLDNLKPSQNTGNPWFEQWWRSKVDCVTGDLSNCESSKTLAGRNVRDVYTPFTLMAVSAIKKGVEAVSQTQCIGSSDVLCSNLLNQNNRGQMIRDAIIKATDQSGIRYFNDNGELSANNVFYNVYKIDAGGNYVLFATGDRNQLSAISGNWPVISNVCPSDPCVQCGEVVSTLPPTTPRPTTTTVPTTTDITEGGKYTQVLMLSSQVFTGVDMDQPRDLYELRFEIGQKWIIALGVLAGVGLLAVLVFEIYILYKLMGTKTGRQWRTLWLGQLLLFGIFLSYLTLFAYLPIPTDVTCGITRFGVGFSYSIMFAVLLVKLMVILTSKSSDSLLAEDYSSPNYLKGIYQFLMFIFVVGVQVVIDAQWLILVPPKAVKVITNNGEEAWICNHFTWEAKNAWNDMSKFVRTDFENHLISLVYIMFLILMNTVVAMKAHGIITNHRESIFIGIASGFSIPIWIAWGLTAGLNKDHDQAQEFTDACMAFGLFITATLVLFSMFLPKVRQLVNMGVEGIYLEDDRESYYAQSVIMAPPSYKSRPNSVIYVNHSDPVLLNGDPNHLKHPGSVYSGHSAPVYTKRPDQPYGSKSLKLTNDLSGKHPQDKKRPQSEVGYMYRKSRSESGGTLRKTRSQTDLGAL